MTKNSAIKTLNGLIQLNLKAAKMFRDLIRDGEEDRLTSSNRRLAFIFETHAEMLQFCVVELTKAKRRNKEISYHIISSI